MMIRIPTQRLHMFARLVPDETKVWKWDSCGVVTDALSHFILRPQFRVVGERWKMSTAVTVDVTFQFPIVLSPARVVVFLCDSLCFCFWCNLNVCNCLSVCTHFDSMMESSQCSAWGSSVKPVCLLGKLMQIVSYFCCWFFFCWVFGNELSFILFINYLLPW